MQVPVCAGGTIERPSLRNLHIVRGFRVLDPRALHSDTRLAQFGARHRTRQKLLPIPMTALQRRPLLLEEPQHLALRGDIPSGLTRGPV